MRTIARYRNILSLPVFILAIFTIFFIGCKKPFQEKENVRVEQSVAPPPGGGGECDLNNTVCLDCDFQEQIEEGDSVDQYSTILGDEYVNPYSISVMTQAYNTIHSTNIQALSPTHLYVRFKPQTVDDLDLLDSLDLDLFDYPLNKNVIQEGEYWPDAYVGLGQNEFPWLYTVVEANFQFPSGITHEVLESEYIPDDDGPLEDLAFQMTGNEECPNNINPSVPECPEGYHWDFNLGTCVENNTCPPGYHWDSNIQGCVPDPSTPLRPHGMINFKTYEDYGVIPPSAPLRYTRIVGRRFLKIAKTYTDANGNFQLSKRFPRKVTIVVKFKISSSYGEHSIRQETNGYGYWKKWYPMRKNIGTFRGNNLQNLNYEFQKGTTSRKWRTRRWLGCVALNTSIETADFLAINNMLALPRDVRIFLNHPNAQNPTAQFEFLYESLAPLNNQNRWFLQLSREDILLNYITNDINSLTTSKATICVGQQLGLVYLNQVGRATTGGTWAQRYNSSVAYGNLYDNGNYWPWGNNVINTVYSYYPELIAKWQLFAQHLGHTIADRVFGWGETVFQLQGKTWTSSGGVSSSMKYLEGFDPNIQPPDERFNWVPTGLINCLMDAIPKTAPVIDNVSGFTYAEIQTAYATDPSSYMSSFKDALKVIKPGQATAIDQLFASYGY